MNGLISLVEGKEHQNELVQSNLYPMMLTKIILKPSELGQVFVKGKGNKDISSKWKEKSNTGHINFKAEFKTKIFIG